MHEPVRSKWPDEKGAFITRRKLGKLNQPKPQSQLERKKKLKQRQGTRDTAATRGREKGKAAELAKVIEELLQPSASIKMSTK